MSEHRETIALLDALIQQALVEYEEGGTAKLWRDLSRTWRRAEAARVAWDPKTWRESYVRLGMLINRGRTQSDRFNELIRLSENRRKLVDSEIKRQRAEANTFTHEEAKTFYGALTEALLRNLTDESDKEKLAAIEDDIHAIMERFRLP